MPRASSGFSEQQAIISNPQLMNAMAVEVSSLLSASKSAPLKFKFNEIGKSARLNVFGNKLLHQFLASIPDFRVAFLVINGPECLSLRKHDWAIFARKHANPAIYIACCITIKEVKNRVVPHYREDGSYSNEVSNERAWMVISVNRLLAVWEGVVADSHYEFFLGQLKKALAERSREGSPPQPIMILQFQTRESDFSMTDRIFMLDLTIGPRHLELTCSIIHGFCLLGRHLGQFGPMAPNISSHPGKLKH